MKKTIGCLRKGVQMKVDSTSCFRPGKVSRPFAVTLSRVPDEKSEPEESRELTVKS